ncbi:MULTISPECIES: hypothetical protein [unclassified Streptomyces]|uniref:hypothetical protein n=1 Tax=unclassified Streptomyces TaxID=2593676 RepID=UPI0036E96368
MGSLRNPIGPLPSSIYWRRRAVAATLVALLALLIVWVVTSGGSKGSTDDSRSGGSGPVRSITPGPSPSGPAISQQPGGRDESGDGGGDDGGTGAGSDGGTDEGGSGADGTAAGSGSGTGTGGSAGGATTGEQVPAGSALPDCPAGAVQLSLSTELTYSPGEKPKFRLVVKNTSATTCKADFGPRSAVLTVTEAGGDDSQVWSSKDCPRVATGPLLKVPAGSTVVHTVEWDRKKSSPQCATAPAGTAGPGTYLVEAKMPGEPVQRASFVLAKD